MFLRSASAPCLFRCLDPARHNAVELREPFSDGTGPRRKNIGRFDLVELIVTHRWHDVPARPGAHLLRTEFLAAPGSDDDVGRTPDNVGRIADDATTRARGLGCP